MQDAIVYMTFRLLSSILLLFILHVSISFANTVVLKAVSVPLIVNGKKATVFDIIQDNGAEGYIGTKGRLFNVLLRNETSVPISIHWHGLILPNNQDGIPYVTQLPISPHQSKHYQFRLLQSGTYWMHSHYRFHEQELMAAPLIIYDSDDPYRDLKDVVVMFQDFSFKNPSLIFADLKKTSQKKMSMSNKRDLNDVSYDAFLANRRTLKNPQIITFHPGEKIRLRLINASSATNYWINTGKLQGVLIALDGQFVKPIKQSLFQLPIAERLDILVTIPKKEGQYPILAQVEGTKKQTGIILKTPEATTTPVSETASEISPPLNDEQEKQVHALQALPMKTITKTLQYSLEGDMKKYVWTINQEVWPRVKPLRINKGDRVAIVFTNNTNMSHPMHLHGHIFQLAKIDDKALVNGPLHDSVLVQPHSSKTIIFDADYPGIWMLHCHVLYHMLAGMMTTTNYVGYPEPYYYKELLKGKIQDE